MAENESWPRSILPEVVAAEFHFYTPEHEVFRATVRRFVDREIMPMSTPGMKPRILPREGYPESISRRPAATRLSRGVWRRPQPIRYASMVEIRRTGAARQRRHQCQPEQPHHRQLTDRGAGTGMDEARGAAEVLAGEKISALAITEPSGGSDVANLKTTAPREGDHYVVNGSKMFITSGVRADYFTVAVRTGGPGAGGVSLLLIERDREGFARTKLKKMGWSASDTAQLSSTMSGCRSRT